ncbi:DUF2793 domain-containing protein [Hoeflea ulvae]|uniref:DUF2793 domain-containing protein n=1 Tax=Hoeflea ulvae TaxID=2983764 RepID=A0ABT3YKQ5_9HYPH|nr:DUF2793 domain-containing protein [Hoeflea ulvae]MCY0096402.1 DUF2793 domain-containing protein [Hoeflea ulvae]
MSNLSPRHALPFLSPSQAQKHVTVNESLRLVDALLQCAVVSATVEVEPTGPQDGEAWILPAGRSGPAWDFIAPGRIAAWIDGRFTPIAPPAGFLAYVIDTGAFVLFDGTGWSAIPLSGANVPSFGINTTADTTNRLAVKADSELLSHDDVTPGSGDARKIINKLDAAHTASLVFQSGYSGRAEIGLMGDNQLAFKVSADGGAFTEVLRADTVTGHLALQRPSAERTLHLGGPTNPGIRLQEDGTAGYGELVNVSAGQTLLSHVSPPGEGALIDLAPIPADGTSSAAFRFFRGTNTSHGCYLTIHAGDGTATYNHQLSGKWDSYLNVTYGNLRIGSATPPVCKLDVAGPVRVGSYAVAALPAASAGAGQIIYVPDETGGAVLAFSDGTNWRRSTDRSVVT